jgi:hypothetical protein
MHLETISKMGTGTAASRGRPLVASNGIPTFGREI